MNEGDVRLGKGEVDAAKDCYERAQAALPDNVESTFWRGVTLAGVGRLEEAREVLERTAEATGEWTELLRRLPAAGLLGEETVSALLHGNY